MMPTSGVVDTTETIVLKALSKSGLALDATQVAERASVPPAVAAAALDRLVSKHVVVRLEGQRDERRSRYAAK